MSKRRTLAESLRYYFRLREVQAALRSDGTDSTEVTRHQFEALGSIRDAIRVLLAEMRPVMCPRSPTEGCPLVRFDGRVYTWDFSKDAPDVLFSEPIDAETTEV